MRFPHTNMNMIMTVHALVYSEVPYATYMGWMNHHDHDNNWSSLNFYTIATVDF